MPNTTEKGFSLLEESCLRLPADPPLDRPEAAGNALLCLGSDDTQICCAGQLVQAGISIQEVTILYPAPQRGQHPLARTALSKMNKRPNRRGTVTYHYARAVFHVYESRPRSRKVESGLAATT
jgi:hypothetical protein